MKKNSVVAALAAGAAILVFSVVPPVASLAAGSITLDQAKKVALDNAGLKATDVTFVKEGMEIDNGRTQYEVEFYSGTTEYDYEIDAATGAIISFDQEIETKYMPAAGTAATTAAPAVAATNGITKDQALQIAFDHAGIKKSDALFTSVKKDFDDGMEIYEVEFHVGFNEYNYDIAASNGQIIDFDIDD